MMQKLPTLCMYIAVAAFTQGCDNTDTSPISEETTEAQTMEEKTPSDGRNEYSEKYPERGYEPLPESISEEKRKEIFLEMSYAEYAAQQKDDYGDDYRNAIAEKHGLSRQQVNQIASDGIANDWPIE